MKRFIVLGAGALALAAGNVHAGGGCAYGQHQAAMADASEAKEAAAEEALSPELLARLKKQEEVALEEALVVPNIPN